MMILYSILLGFPSGQISDQGEVNFAKDLVCG